VAASIATIEPSRENHDLGCGFFNSCSGIKGASDTASLSILDSTLFHRGSFSHRTYSKLGIHLIFRRPATWPGLRWRSCSRDFLLPPKAASTFCKYALSNIPRPSPSQQQALSKGLDRTTVILHVKQRLSIEYAGEEFSIVPGTRDDSSIRSITRPMCKSGDRLGSSGTKNSAAVLARYRRIQEVYGLGVSDHQL
jgi:hypothetical protein